MKEHSAEKYSHDILSKTDFGTCKTLESFAVAIIDKARRNHIIKEDNDQFIKVIERKLPASEAASIGWRGKRDIKDHENEPH